MHRDSPFVWLAPDGRRIPATENLVPGNQVYKEKLVRRKGAEYRMWDPFRSKLAAAILNGLEHFPFSHGSSVLYLGASTGTTVSHLSDIVGTSGSIFAVEHSSRVARELLNRVVEYRPNIIPIIQDARKPDQYFSMYGKADIAYSDIAQPDQTEIAITNCNRHLAEKGVLFMVVKARSIDVRRSPEKIIAAETEKLRGAFRILQTIDLMPYDKDHGMVVARKKD